MENLTFVKGYQDDTVLRKSFNELAESVFGIQFEEWYQKGYWTEKYKPYSFLDGKKIVANVSVNRIELLINTEKITALQIGTVMTHPDFRGRGLSRKLIEKVLEDYENKYDMMYLFANQTVLDFYPKFGFKIVNEHLFSMSIQKDSENVNRIRKLDGNNVDDLDFIYRCASNRVPVSNRFAASNTQELLMFYCQYVFSKDIYYIESDEVIAIYQTIGNEVHLYDLISVREINIESIVQKIAGPETEKIIFHFTPESGSTLQMDIFKSSNTLFVRSGREVVLPEYFKHPITSQA